MPVKFVTIAIGSLAHITIGFDRCYTTKGLETTRGNNKCLQIGIIGLVTFFSSE